MSQAELGNEKKLVGRASAPARRSAQAGKPVPPEELFRTVPHGPSAHPKSLKSPCLPLLLTLNLELQDRINLAGTEARPTGLFLIYGYPQVMSRRGRGGAAIDGGRRI